MPPEHQLLEQEEKQDANQQGSQDACGRQLFESGRQDGKRGDAKERADRITHQPRDQPGTSRVADQENAGGNQEPAEPAHETQSQGDEVRRHDEPSYYGRWPSVF